MDEPKRWVGWRRPRGTDDAWALLPETEAGRSSEAYGLCMDDMLKAGDADWEYRIMPVGVVPERYARSKTYRDRMMRPERT